MSSYGLDSDPWSASASVAERGSRLLVVTSVPAEREAIERGIASARTNLARPSSSAMSSSMIITIDGGVGVASAAAATATTLCRREFAGVISAGLAGGIGVPPGGLALGTCSVAADLGAEDDGGFLSLDELGLGPSAMDCHAGLAARLSTLLPAAVRGAILTVSTVTGTAARADWLRLRHPDAVAEAMEGFGVATAAAPAGVPFAEIRAVSNAVGPRDREAWKIPEALAALERVGAALATLGA